jgi:multimeric flavodoxin WrbA
VRILLVNGSYRADGCTYTALSEVKGAIEESGASAEILHIGADPVGGCMACGRCRELGDCVLGGIVSILINKAAHADGFVFGSPVHYAAPAGALLAVLHRAAYAGGRYFRNKPGAAVVSCRRGGAASALDTLNKLFPILGMPMAPSQYWTMVHGQNPDDVKKDLEGLQTARLLGRYIVWMAGAFGEAAKYGVTPPELEPRISTNFIR